MRLHIVANGDQESDQKLKLLVRDAVVARARALTECADGEDAAFALLCQNAASLRASAKRAARANGYEGDIRISMGKMPFPAKRYGAVLLKEGVYRAARVEIGDANGRNWWCVLYPSLCYLGDTQSGDVQLYSSLLTWLRALLSGGTTA